MRFMALISATFFVVGCGDTAPPAAQTAPDVGTGDVAEEPAMMTMPDPCVDLDQCPNVDPGMGGSGGSGGMGNGGSGGMGGGMMPAGPYAAGDKALARQYLPIRKQPDSTAAIIESIPPSGGIDDSSHNGMPLGYLSPGQEVTIVDPVKTNNYYKVQYEGVTGWVHAYKIVRVDPTLHPIKYAMQEDVRPAFFKRQVYHGQLNKDGPYTSGTCAPTSLAMALRIFGKEPSGLSIEQSIHRVRTTYGDNSDLDGTLRSQIHTAAEKLGMSVVELSEHLSPTAALDRLDTQLGKNRVVQFEGIPGQTYRDRYTAAHKTAGEPAYTFKGKHSILVVAKDGDKYLVADPLSRVGMLMLTRPELRSFIEDASDNPDKFGGTGNAVWVPQN
ncbi:MAG TPA: SH3 domain-containing protein [Polyangium sp.]|nr:SH3 domain-containing protein [Polyangium sp.]